MMNLPVGSTINKRMVLGKFAEQYVYICGEYTDQLESGTPYSVSTSFQAKEIEEKSIEMM